MICGAALLGLAATPAFAQSADVEEIVVTGSRIARPNLDSPTPVQVIGQDKLTSKGLENVADVLITLPQFAPTFGASRTQSTFSGTADSGLNLINLRNLGTQRSLVLINGRRAPSGSISDNAVDLNMIPSVNISRIDVITGGASAIYGADAVSGVVNIITDKRFKGVEVGVSYGEALKHNDNQNPSAYIKMGTGNDRGHVVATAQYDYQGYVSCADRALCSQDFAWFPPGDPVRGDLARSGVPPMGRFFVDGAPGSYVLNNGALDSFTVGKYGFNRNETRTLAIPTKRIMASLEADYQFFDGVTAFLEVNYGRAKVRGPFEAHPFDSSSDLVGGVLEPSIPTSNPFLPTALRNLALANGDDEITWFQRLSGLEARGSDNTREMNRIAFGIRGERDSLFGIGKDWNYELSYVWGRTRLEGKSLGSVSTEALYNGLRVEAVPGGTGYRCVSAAARAQGCIPINPFDGYSSEEQAYLLRTVGLLSRYDLGNGLAYLSGSLFDLPAGPFQVAAGAETRRIVAFEDYSDEINQKTVTGNQISDSARTKFRTDEFFVEAKAPILRDMPFFSELNVEAAYRWSDGHEVGKYETWKYGGDWSPVRGLRFRAMMNRAVRAPTLAEVTGVGETFGAIDDPCVNYGSSPNATLRANCAALGMPANYDPPLTVLQNVSGFEGGNPNVKPERADTFTYGFVLQAGSFDFMPAALRELSISVDRFRIELKDQIGLIGRQTIAQQCYTLSGADRDIFCNQVTRGTDPTLPGANYVLTSVNDQYQNIASLNLKGMDVEVNYGVNLSDLFGGNDIGRISVNSVWTFYNKAKSVPYPGADPINLLGAAGGDTGTQGWLKRQSNTTVAWSNSKLRLAWTLRYIGATNSAPADIFGEDAIVKIKSHTYSDFSARYNVTKKVEVYGGVSNAFDKKPPFFPSSQSGTQALDTIPAYYDIFGRQAYAGVKMRF